ncbi:MAG: tyrosine-protein phosphatase [Mycobacteriales bacterium]
MDAAARTLPWPDLWNARGLGGLPTPSRPKAPGALIRSDSLVHLTAAGRQMLLASGVRRVIDLRAADEAVAEPDPELPAGAYLGLPIRGVDYPGHGSDSRRAVYRTMLDDYQDLMARAVGAIGSAPPGGVLVHCHAGKDRTGLVIALALAVAGVPDADIAADYGYRGPGLLAEAQRVIDRSTVPADRDLRFDRQSADPETMLAVLEHLRAAHGGVEKYLMAGGLDAGAQDVVRRRLLTAP